MDASGVARLTTIYPGQNQAKHDRDGIFTDGFTSELATVAGNAGSGYTATFQVGITL